MSGGILWTDNQKLVSETKRCGVGKDQTHAIPSLSPRVWVAFSYGDVAELHVFPKGQSITKEVCLTLRHSSYDCFAVIGANVQQ